MTDPAKPLVESVVGEQHKLEAEVEVAPPSPEEEAALNEAGFELRDHAWRPAERVVIVA